MTSNRRQKQLAREKYERQSARRSQSAASRRRRQRIIGGIVVVALVVAAGVWVVAGRSGSDAEPVAEAAPTSAASPEASAASPAATVAPSDASAPAASAAASPASTLVCTEPTPVRADTLTFATAPTPPATPGTPSTITLATNCGPIVITTVPDAAPLTVASEVFLAQQGFYDGTQCHRVTTAGIFVLQCGDPKGDGTGGPGYTVPDENLPAESAGNYPAGTIAMANAGPGTSGSQFFIVYDDTTLPAGYTIWGNVTSGLDVVKQIAAAGAQGGSGDGAPVQPVVIETATVSAA